MKRLIFSLVSVFSTLYLFAQSENTFFVNSNAKFYVTNTALTTVIGSVKVKGLVQNKGKVMLFGNSNSVFKTLNQDNTDATFADIQAKTSGIFLNALNQPNNFVLANTTTEGNNYTYGQLYISGFNQSNITGFVSEEYRNVNHGAYQQIGFPFYNKSLPELNTELGKTFSDVRWSQNEILKYSNTNVVFDYVNLTTPIADPSGYYILGNKYNSLDVSNNTRTISGKPYTDGSSMVYTLQNAGNAINFGANGTAINAYGETYKSYLQDGFELQAAIGGTAWQDNFGKNIYQFSNPFLMNIDLRNIFVNESNGDGVYLSNIYGIRLEQASGTVSYTPGVGGGATSFRYVTWDNATNSPIGDVDWLMIRPLGTFVIKLKDNSSAQTLDFNSLRRFSYIPRLGTATYSPTSKKNETLKQLGVIALDANNKEIGRCYYVVSPNGKSGHQNTPNFQVSASSSNVIGSFEEEPINGGYDYNYTSKYWLYINEANEIDFKGKAIPMVIYKSEVKSIKFELRENGNLSPIGTQELSSGVAFYYNTNGTVTKIKQGDSVPVSFSTSLGVKLYYGAPQNTTLSTDGTKPSRTMVIYNPAIEKYIVRFDSNWKKADIELYDMSGRLVLREKGVIATQDYPINFNSRYKEFILKIISSEGELLTTKIRL